jgi:hypothetical protein
MGPLGGLFAVATSLNHMLSSNEGDSSEEIDDRNGMSDGLVSSFFFLVLNLLSSAGGSDDDDDPDDEVAWSPKFFPRTLVRAVKVLAARDGVEEKAHARGTLES